jgi:hypothetical protein
MKEKIVGYALAVGSYLLRKVLPFDVIVIALVGLSFLVWKGFAVPALVNRLVMTGLVISIIGGFLLSSETIGGRSYGIPTYTAALSSNLIDWNIEIRKNIEAKLDFRYQVFFIGAVAFLAGVLIDLVSK